jgi:type I restriction enzyme R subunit
MNELKIQHDYVMEFLCRQEEKGGLGYRSESNIVVSNDLFIPFVMGEFVKNSQPETWNRLLRKFDNDEQTLQTALKDKVKETLLDAQNVAIYINGHKSITFEGEKVWLFYVSGTELKGDEEFKQNIFCVVEESSHTLKAGDTKLYTIRPDIMFFVNGIYIGYMELKSSTKGQTARVNGRQKVAKDYLATVKALTKLEKRDAKAMKQRKEVMAIYEKAIHLTASDCNETYVMRGISQFFDIAHQGFYSEPAKTVDQLTPTVLEPFKVYPVTVSAQTETERFEEVMRALYSKKMIEKEILYYNFIEYKYVKKEGVKERTSNTGRLIAPRPKQKFGCDKIMGRITEMLDHENEPGYYINKLRNYLETQGITPQKIEEIILLRERYFNNKYVYSLLLQYAAGFGKSNIIGWTALQLKDYRYEGVYAYDKIMIVVDRLQLRDQLDTMMMNMNIDKSMFVEATDRDTFINALDSKLRIIVVNIQKFLDLQDALSAAGKKLKKMRVAFLIDEIHRSNSGENNQEMIDLFARLQETFNVGGQTVVKKNLLIGFTATPSEETLARFGEFRSALTKPMWIPFDCYTMREAIEDGYILDPTKAIIPYAVPVDFQLPEELENSDEDDIDIVLRKDRVYSFEPRMRKIAEFIVHRLVSLVYKKIRGEGKAMLAVRSIPNAIKYFNIIRSLYAEKCQEPAYEKYKDAPIVIIYSDDQKNESCATLNGGVSEEKVIQNFRQAKNGLIIVVDKLQTGFDEPKLHTLFLDKEISDINAIQTISRVNRICKYKEDCHIVDCSWHNVNVENIRWAFEKFCDMAISDFNPEFEAKSVARTYKLLQASEPYLQWYSRYQHECEDTHFVLEMEDGIRKWIEQCFYQESLAKKYNEDNGLKPSDADYHAVINPARDLRNLVGHYFSGIRLLDGVFVIDRKYYDEVFLMFWQIYCHIYREVTYQIEEEPYEYEVIDSDEEPGITLVDGEGNGDGGGGQRGPQGGSGPQPPKGKSMDEVLAILQRLHETEQLTAEQAQVWLREIGLMFEYIKGDSEFCAFAQDDNYTEEEKLAEYKKVQGRYRRSLKNRPDFAQVERFKQMIIENVEQLFSIFMADLRNVENGDSDFDYDTTNQEQPKEGFSMEDLMEMARRKIRPDYNETALKERIVASYATHFNGLSKYMPSFDETVDSMFKVLNTPSLPGLDGVDSVVKESLNMVCMAEGLSLSDKRMHLDMLLLRYEVYLKKLYYLIHGEELPAREEGQGATLSNAIFAFPALRGLKNNPKPEYQEFSQRLSMLRQLRNHESHGSLEISEQEVDAAIRIVIDMYLFVTGMNVDNLSDENEATKTPLHSVNYEVREDSDLPMAAENIFVYGSIPVDLPKINRNDLVENKLDLVLMYAIGNPVARKKTEAVGKIALGIKEKVLNEIQKTSYKSVKYLMFHYWKDPKTFQLTKVPLLVEVEDVPADFLVRQPNDAVKYLLLEYNPNEPINMDDINILRTQRRGEIRYMPFVTTIESVTEEK